MADYYTLLTNAGIAYENACKAAGVPIKLSKISVGDGNGAAYNPAATATALKREVWRGPLNALFQDDKNPSWLLAEVTIPAEVGGWYVREAGIWTDTGILYAIVKYPESFKPVLATSGSGKEFYIRSIFETSNASQVTLLIDDTVVKATRAWVIDYVAGELSKLDGKQSVRVATTANIVLSGAQQIDDVAVVEGDRVLVTRQTVGKDNGIYVAATGAWVRAVDADNSLEVTPGLFVGVEAGTVNGDSVWQLVTDAPIVLGTTALVFEMAAGRTGIAAGSYRSVTVDKYGRVIAGTNPTTLASSGITDALPLTGGTLTGSLNLTAAKSVYIQPVQSPSWAAGLIAGEFNREKAGIGYLGSNDSVNVVFMGLGATPWVNGYGIRVSTGGVEIAGPISGDGSGLTGLKFSALTGLPNSLSGYGVPFASQVEAETGADTNKPMNALRTFQAIAAKVIQATESKLGIAQIASKVLVDAGDDDSTIVTPKKQRWGFRILIGRVGYIVFPTWLKGWIVQWNVGVSLTGSAVNTSYFPIPFPTDVGAVVVGAYNNSGSGSYTVGLSDGVGGSKGAVFADRFTTYNNGVTGSAGMSYIAVGT